MVTDEVAKKTKIIDFPTARLQANFFLKPSMGMVSKPISLKPSMGVVSKVDLCTNEVPGTYYVYEACTQRKAIRQRPGYKHTTKQSLK